MSSDESFFQFKLLETPESVKQMFNIFKAGCYEEQVFQRQFSQKFIADLYQFLEKSNHAPKIKFHSLLVLKEIIAMNDIKFVGVLSNSVAFLEYLQGIAMKVDPKKTVSDKGKTLFSNDKQGYGNKYIHLILEIMQYLGKKFPRTSKGQPTRFKKILTKIQSQNVTLPQQFTYFPKQKVKQDQSSKPPKNDPQKRTTTEQDRPNQKNDKGNNPSFQSLVRFSKNKIQIYIGELEEAEEVEEMQKKIMSAHEILSGYLTKFQELGESVYNPIPGKSEKQFQQILEEYLKVLGFLQEQKKIYEKQISRNEFASYYDQLKLKYQQIYPETNQTPTPTSKIPKPKSTINQKQSLNTNNNNNNNNKQTSKIETNNNNKGAYKSTDSVIKNQNGSMSKMENPGRVSGIDRNSAKGNAGGMVASIFQRIQNKSKSPYNGFKDIRQSLEKEKNNIHAHPANRYLNTSKQPPKQPTKSIFSSSLTTSKISDPIFTSPPNPNPPYKSFQGQQIPPNRQLQHILFDIKKQQGHRRFKLANFKNKSLLFENQCLEVGCKTQGIFQSYEGFDVFLGVELFLGNKGTLGDVWGVEVSYEGDQNCLIYCSPREIASVIDSQMQIKHELMIVPIKIPFSFINMRLSYTTKSGTTRTTIALPTSILKLSNPCQPLPTPKTFSQTFPTLTKLLKSHPFKLSHLIPPLSIKKYLPYMIELTSYNDFIKGQGYGNVDYQLGAFVEICQIYQVVVKVCVRGDLGVVVQVGARDPSQDGVKYMRFYLETLQVMLQEISG